MNLKYIYKKLFSQIKILYSEARRIIYLSIEVHKLRSAKYKVIFADEGKITVNLPKVSFMDIIMIKQLKLVSLCVKFKDRPSHEVLLRKIVFDLYKNNILDKKKSVIDIGAWIADNTIVWAKIIDNRCAKVFAIDPSLDNIKFGKTLSMLNDVNNISWHQNVCADKENVELHFEGNWGLATFNKERKGNTSPILSTTIDAILGEANFGSVGLFHIDVEGFEELTLKGAERVLAASKPIILFEQHITRENPEKIFKFLKERSYDIYMINEVLLGCALDCRNFLAVSLGVDLSSIINQNQARKTSEQVYEAAVGPCLIAIDLNK